MWRPGHPVLSQFVFVSFVHTNPYSYYALLISVWPPIAVVFLVVLLCGCMFGSSVIWLLLFHLPSVNLFKVPGVGMCTCVEALVYKLRSEKIIQLQLPFLFSTCFLNWLYEITLLLAAIKRPCLTL